MGLLCMVGTIAYLVVTMRPWDAPLTSDFLWGRFLVLSLLVLVMGIAFGAILTSIMIHLVPAIGGVANAAFERLRRRRD